MMCDSCQPLCNRGEDARSSSLFAAIQGSLHQAVRSQERFPCTAVRLVNSNPSTFGFVPDVSLTADST